MARLRSAAVPAVALIDAVLLPLARSGSVAVTVPVAEPAPGDDGVIVRVIVALAVLRRDAIVQTAGAVPLHEPDGVVAFAIVPFVALIDTCTFVASSGP